MLVTKPAFEFDMPLALRADSARHWRMARLSVHLHWYLVTLDGGEEQGAFARIHTFCVMWERDLAAMLEALDTTTLVGLICMLPGWDSPSGHWSSRPIQEVWLHVGDNGQETLVFVDDAGKRFSNDGSVSSVAEHKTHLLAQVGKTGVATHAGP